MALVKKNIIVKGKSGKSFVQERMVDPSKEKEKKGMSKVGKAALGVGAAGALGGAGLGAAIGAPIALKMLGGALLGGGSRLLLARKKLANEARMKEIQHKVLQRTYEKQQEAMRKLRERKKVK